MRPNFSFQIAGLALLLAVSGPLQAESRDTVVRVATAECPPFAMVDDSPHIETLNQALLAVRKSPAWKRELATYLGSE